MLDLDGRPLRACSIHLDANWSELRAADGQFHLTSMELAQLAWAEFFGQTSRRLAVQALIWQLRGERQMPTLLGGDFNTLPWSSTIRTISRSLRDTAWLTKTYLRGTYHDLSESFQPRIDYLFVSRNVQARQTQVVSCPTGDHYPVRTELRTPACWAALRHGEAATLEHDAALGRERFATVIDVGANKGQFAVYTRLRWPRARKKLKPASNVSRDCGSM
ncbi:MULTISPECIES: endonuclease/exonuclease/phosphatase family protein [Thiorhodovibrio]|uniref:endonuclease/exonuclease/phosphatase family protein n=1 Tax=Thiorhodovibrio TaxID=61593 RepID=UPI001912F8C4|nr:endonuclease/exonuclease/phosphatase family protein [Thiorhodovibrio litoralis]